MGIRSVAADIGNHIRHRCSESTQVQHWDLTTGVASERRDHIDTRSSLWLQNAIRNREYEVQKVAGEENVADVLTKNVKSEVLRETHGTHVVSPRQQDEGCVRRGMCDGLHGCSMSSSASQYSEPDQCSANKHWERCGTTAVAAEEAAGRFSRITTRELDGLMKVFGGRTHIVGQETMWVQQASRETVQPSNTPSTMDYLRWARQRMFT